MLWRFQFGQSVGNIDDGIAARDLVRETRCVKMLSAACDLADRALSHAQQ
jgi:hypothetical protein